MESQKPDNLDQWIYLEKPSPFINIKHKAGKPPPVMKYGMLLHSIGIIEGTIQEWDLQSKRGKIDLQGYEYDFKVERQNLKEKFDQFIGNKMRFLFWPNVDELPQKKGKKFSHFTCLKISRSYKEEPAQTWYVEAAGKLEQIWSNEFLLSLWSMQLKRLLYIPVAGEYPFSDEVGQCIRVEGEFDPKAGVIRLRQAGVIAFVPPEEAQKIEVPQKRGKLHGADRNKKNRADQVRKQKELKRRINALAVEKIVLTDIVVPQLEESAKLNPWKFKKQYEMIKGLYQRQGKTPTPVVVKPLNGGKYLLEDGLIRLKIAKELGHKTIDARVFKQS